jgi:hypothetical protein
LLFNYAIETVFPIENFRGKKRNKRALISNYDAIVDAKYANLMIFAGKFHSHQTVRAMETRGK